jgi:hypothetical protein
MYHVSMVNVMETMKFSIPKIERKRKRKRESER